MLMCTVTIEYNRNRKAIDLLLSAIEELGAKVVTTKDEDPHYSPEFIAKMQRGMEAYKKGECVTVDLDNLWN